MHRGRHRRPKIAERLGEPRAAVVRSQIAAARSQQIGVTLYLEMRTPTVTYEYGDPEHPDRPTRTVSSPPYTREDRALLMAYEAYESTLCRCGVPIAIAWHSEMDGYPESDPAVCHFCSALQGRQVVYPSTLRNTRDPDRPMPEFIPGKTITAPDKGP